MGGLLLVLGLTGAFLCYIITKTLYLKASEENERYSHLKTNI